MKRKLGGFSVIAIVSTMLFGTVLNVDAQRRNEREVRDALRSLASKLDDFEANLRFQMQSGSSNDSDLGTVQDDIRDMRGAVSRFSDNLDRRRENQDDVEQIVNVARILDDFLLDNQQNRRVTDTWVDIKRQLDRLASNYGVTNNWATTGSSTYSQPQPTYTPAPVYTNPGRGSSVVVGLSGTYNLDAQRSERVDDIVSDSGASGGNVEDLREKLDAPDQIAIDVRGTQVTLATSKATPVSLTADGRDKVERDAQGRNIRMRATLTGDKLIVSSIGGETDYTITFTSSNNGQVLKVSRRITTDYLNQTVFAESVYNKTDTVARLGIPAGGVNNNDRYDTILTTGSSGNTNSTSDPNGGYSDNDQGNATISNGGTGSNNNNRGYNPTAGRPSAVYVKPGNYTVPDGSMVTGILDSEINTKYSQNGDRFKMTVQSPNEFRGAVVQGYIANIQRSGKVTGTAAVTLIFEKITLRNGQTYDFAGTLRTAADALGKAAKVDNEGTIRGENQTNNTAKRGGIGAGIGALIGAIAGGGKGAAIGAILGGGAGAGSVALEDKKDVQLNVGSTLTVQAAAPSSIR